MSATPTPQGEASVLTLERARDAGYRIHQGTPDDGDLDGLFWWTLLRDGWMAPEAGAGEWITRSEAEGAAVAAFALESSDMVGPFAKP